MNYDLLYDSLVQCKNSRIDELIVEIPIKNIYNTGYRLKGSSKRIYRAYIVVMYIEGDFVIQKNRMSQNLGKVTDEKCLDFLKRELLLSTLNS
jgi:hypothetical protein